MSIPPGDYTTPVPEPVPPQYPVTPPDRGVRLSRRALWRIGIGVSAVALVAGGILGAGHIASIRENGTVAKAYEKRVTSDLRDATQDLTITTPTPTPNPYDKPHSDPGRDRPKPTPEETLHKGDSNVDLIKKSLHTEMRTAERPYDQYVESVTENPAGTVTVTMSNRVSGVTNDGYQILANLLKLDVLGYTSSLESVIVQNHDGSVRGESV